MFNAVSLTLDATNVAYYPVNRILDPSNLKSNSWIATSLPYHLDPGQRLRVRSKETRSKNIKELNYLIQPDPSITDTGLLLTYSSDFDNTGRYYFVIHNSGTSTVLLSAGIKLAKILIFTSCSDSEDESVAF